MKQHEREFFIYRVRSGIVRYEDYRILPPTLEDKIDASEAYITAYNEAIADEMMTEDEVEAWMLENGLWSEEDQKKLDTAEKDIRTLKKEMFNHHRDGAMVNNIRKLLKGAKKFHSLKLKEKSEFLSNTAEQAARQMELLTMIQNATEKDGKPIDWDKEDQFLINELIAVYIEDIFNEEQIRELARTAPWTGLWNIKDNLKHPLFSMADRELTTNQHALTVWSQTYDNIQESIDCPTDEVINDDDMLDGWFIIQGEKRQKDKAERDFEEGTKSDKIKNSSEVFVMSKGKKDDDRIKLMNSQHGEAVKQQRFNLIKKKGSAQQQDFADEKLRLQTMSNNKFKDTVTRR